MHLNHDNILEYCNRPFKDALTALHQMTVNFNQKMREEDRAVHVGDFMSRGNVKGKPSLPFRFDQLRRLFNGQWSFLRGNHDENNGVKCLCTFLWTEIGPYKAFVGHYPMAHPIFPYSEKIEEYIHMTCDLVICGHVHNAWKTTFINGVLHINVGVDVWDFFPVSDGELIQLAAKELKR